jgi:hypothetical protein
VLPHLWGNWGPAGSGISGGKWSFSAGSYGGGTYLLSQNIQTVLGDTYTLGFDSTLYSAWGYVSAKETVKNNFPN